MGKFNLLNKVITQFKTYCMSIETTNFYMVRHFTS